MEVGTNTIDAGKFNLHSLLFDLTKLSLFIIITIGLIIIWIFHLINHIISFYHNITHAIHYCRARQNPTIGGRYLGNNPINAPQQLPTTAETILIARWILLAYLKRLSDGGVLIRFLCERFPEWNDDDIFNNYERLCKLFRQNEYYINQIYIKWTITPRLVRLISQKTQLSSLESELPSNRIETLREQPCQQPSFVKPKRSREQKLQALRKRLALLLQWRNLQQQALRKRYLTPLTPISHPLRSTNPSTSQPIAIGKGSRPLGLPTRARPSIVDPTKEITTITTTTTTTITPTSTTKVELSEDLQRILVRRLFIIDVPKVLLYSYNSVSIVFITSILMNGEFYLASLVILVHCLFGRRSRATFYTA